MSQWPAGADTGPSKPLYSPAAPARTPAEARRPIQTSKPPKDKPSKEDPRG